MTLNLRMGNKNVVHLHKEYYFGEEGYSGILKFADKWKERDKNEPEWGNSDQEEK